MIEKSWLQMHKQCVLDLHFLLPVHKPVHINGVLYMYVSIAYYWTNIFLYV